MARIPYPEKIIPELQAVDELGFLHNLFRLGGHSPVFSRLAASVGAGYSDLDLTTFERELSVLVFAQAFGTEYEWTQHLPIAQELGLTDEQKVAIEIGNLDTDVFTTEQRALVRLVDGVARQTRIADDILEDFLAVHSHQKLLDVLYLNGIYFMVARVSTNLDVELDPSSGIRWFRSTR